MSVVPAKLKRMLSDNSKLLWAGMVIGALYFYQVLGFYQTLSPVWDWFNDEITRQLGKSWLQHMLYSPIFLLVLICLYARLLWRAGDKVSKREMAQEEARAVERGKVQELPEHLMTIFWKNELLRSSEAQKVQCALAIDSLRQSLVIFHDQLPIYDRPRPMGGAVEQCRQAALANCDKFKAIMGASVVFHHVHVPGLVYVAIPEGEPRPSVASQKLDAVNNAHYFAANEAYIHFLNAYYGALVQHFERCREEVNRASDDLKSKLDARLLGQA